MSIQSAAMTAISFILIEDDPGHAFLFKKFLKNEGVVNEVIHFTDGRKFLDSLSSKILPSDSVLILDLNLPLLHGKEVISIIRKSYSSSDIPIIVLSTTMDTAEIQEVQSRDCQGCLRKPLEAKVFFEVLEELKSEYVFRESPEGTLCLYKIK